MPLRGHLPLAGRALRAARPGRPGRRRLVALTPKLDARRLAPPLRAGGLVVDGGLATVLVLGFYAFARVMHHGPYESQAREACRELRLGMTEAEAIARMPPGGRGHDVAGGRVWSGWTESPAAATFTRLSFTGGRLRRAVCSDSYSLVAR